MTSPPLPRYAVGPINVDPGLVLAPMSGVTDSPFRRMVIAASGDAVGMVMSEFISIEMLTRQQLRASIRLGFHETERPIAIQLYGADIDRMAEAARMVEDAGADMVDINCGCPAPKIVRRGGGAGLLRDLPHLAKLVDATVRAVSIPVTIKVRNGWCDDSINAMESLKLAQGCGAQAFAVHGRTRMQLYRGEADWEIIRQLKEVATIPVLGSGDILTAQDARRRFAQTGCDGVMIGRGAITNPWIFRQIADQWQGRPAFSPTWRATLALLRLYKEMLAEQYPAKVVPGRLKMMLSRLLKGFRYAARTRIECLRLQAPDAMLGHLESVCEALGVMDHRRDDPRNVSGTSDDVALAKRADPA